MASPFGLPEQAEHYQWPFEHVEKWRSLFACADEVDHELEGILMTEPDAVTHMQWYRLQRAMNFMMFASWGLQQRWNERDQAACSAR